MKHVSNLLNIADVKVQKEQERSEEMSKETAAVINWLFKELRGSFTAFKQAWPTQDEFRAAKKVWLKAFMLAGIKSIEQLQHGLNKCYLMENPFVPSPGEFIAWCKPSAEALGFPGEEKAFHISILLNRQFPDPVSVSDEVRAVIKHVIQEIGPSTYREMTSEKARKLFKATYAEAVTQYVNGSFKPIRKALSQDPEPHPFDKKRSDEARLKCMQSLRSNGIAIKTTMPENDI